MGTITVGDGLSQFATPCDDALFNELNDLIAAKDDWRSHIRNPQGGEGRAQVIENPVQKHHLAWVEIKRWMCGEICKNGTPPSFADRTAPVTVRDAGGKEFSLRINRGIYRHAIQTLAGGDESKLWQKIDVQLRSLRDRLAERKERFAKMAKQHNAARDMEAKLIPLEPE